MNQNDRELEKLQRQIMGELKKQPELLKEVQKGSINIQITTGGGDAIGGNKFVLNSAADERTNDYSRLKLRYEAAQKMAGFCFVVFLVVIAALWAFSKFDITFGWNGAVVAAAPLILAGLAGKEAEDLKKKLFV
ncbi:hypothetical protein [uncultured Deefgea sp.]|uniref:hypothetical protein n=1 Tax=uncultured Deefgea sp. TaxID=1304914 RepID=UPI0025922B99|nr:hypothetical protein [uncultured Deefgea sp.]